MGGRVGRIDEKVIHVDNKPSFCDHVYIDVFRKSRCGSIMGLVLSHIHSVTLVEVSRFIDGFVKDQSLCGPVDRGVGFL